MALLSIKMNTLRLGPGSLLPFFFVISLIELTAAAFYSQRALTDSSLSVLDKTCSNVGLSFNGCAGLNFQYAIFKLIAVIVASILTYFFAYFVSKKPLIFEVLFSRRKPSRNLHMPASMLIKIVSLISFSICNGYVALDNFSTPLLHSYDRNLYLEKYRLVVLLSSFSWPIIFQIGDWFYSAGRYFLAFKIFALGCLTSYSTTYRFSFVLSVVIFSIYFAKFLIFDKRILYKLRRIVRLHGRKMLIIFLASASLFISIFLVNQSGKVFSYAAKFDPILRRVVNGSLYSTLSYRYMNAHHEICNSNISHPGVPSLKRSCDQSLGGFIASTRAIHDLSYPYASADEFGGTVTVGIWGDAYTFLRGNLWISLFIYTIFLAIVGEFSRRFRFLELYIVISVCRWHFGGIYDIYDNIILGIMVLIILSRIASRYSPCNDL